MFFMNYMNAAACGRRLSLPIPKSGRESTDRLNGPGVMNGVWFCNHWRHHSDASVDVTTASTALWWDHQLSVRGGKSYETRQMSLAVHVQSSANLFCFSLTVAMATASAAAAVGLIHLARRRRRRAVLIHQILSAEWHRPSVPRFDPVSVPAGVCHNRRLLLWHCHLWTLLSHP